MLVRSTPVHHALWAAPWLGLWAGCLTAEPPPPLACTGCHGSVDAGPAPPSALGGYSDPSYRGVGAHQTHLVPAFSNAVACTECHVVPDTIDAPGHVDSLWPAEVSWDEAEIRANSSEPFDGDALSCTVYCHGATLTGGSNTNPVWTVPFEGAVCDDCHGFPPPPPHPVSEDCSGCHPNPLVGSDVHIDGVLQVDE